MSRPAEGIRITPRLIELPDRIIRVPNIASVTIDRDPDKRKQGQAMMLMGLILGLMSIASGALSPVSPYYPRADSGPGLSTILLFASVSLVASGVVMVRRRALFISTSDGKATILVDKNQDFMHEVMARIREALLAGEASTIVYQVNVQAQRIERIDASTNSVEVVNSPGSNVIAGDAIGSNMAAIALPPPQPAMRVQPIVPPVEQMLDSVLARAGTVAPSLESLLRGAREQPTQSSPQPPPMPFPGDPQPPLSELSLDRTTRAVQVAQSPGSITVGGNVHAAAFQTHVVATPVGDLDELMRILVAQNVANHQQLNSYLAAVRDHLAGGPTSREHAAGYWNWFAEYALATLSGVEGVIALVERIGTVFR